MSNLDQIVNKIKKLLSLSSSDNQHEAELASAKASELLMKYNLDRKELDSEASDYVSIVAHTGRVRVEDKFVANILTGYFFVRIVASSESGERSLLIFGEKLNAEIANYMYSFLYHQFKALWASYRKATGAKPGDKQAYYLGLMKGIETQLNAKREALKKEKGLVVIKDHDLARMFDEEFGNTRARGRTKIKSNAEAMKSGVNAGVNMQIRAGVNGGEASQSGKYIA